MEGDEDLFPPAPPEEVLRRKIEVVEILIKRFEEQLERAETFDPRALSLQKAEWIIKDLEGIVSRVEELKKKIYSKKSDQSN